MAEVPASLYYARIALANARKGAEKTEVAIKFSPQKHAVSRLEHWVEALEDHYGVEHE